MKTLKQAEGTGHGLGKSIHPWVGDLLAWLIACVGLLVIVSLLAHWNGRRTADWSSHIQISTLISTLASITYLFLMIPIASSISQLKWNHFVSRKALYDFHTIDQASRSVFACVTLVLSKPLWTLPVLGALVTIIIQALGPFLQQIVSQHPIRTKSTDQVGWVPVLVSVPLGHVSEYNSNIPEVDLATRGALAQGMYTNGYLDFNLTEQAICQISDCTWAEYASLGFCSMCVNITSIATVTGDATEEAVAAISLPNNVTVKYNAENTTYLSVFATAPSIMFRATPAVLLDFFAVTPTQAYECNLRLCARTYRSRHRQRLGIDGGEVGGAREQRPGFTVERRPAVLGDDPADDLAGAGDRDLLPDDGAYEGLESVDHPGCA